MSKTRLRNFLLSPRTLLIVWVIIAIASVLVKIPRGAEAYNNFWIFRGVAHHLFAQEPLFVHYPAEFEDMNHYGPIFGILIAPFAWIPGWLAIPLWVVGLTVALYAAIRRLPLETKWQCIILWLAANDLFCAGLMQQFNIGVAAMIIAALILVRRKREGWATMLIALGTFIKIYPVVGLAFFFFSERKVRFALYFIFWSAVMLFLPLIFVSWQYLWGEYVAWFVELQVKNGQNYFECVQNVSILGTVRKISGDPNYSDLWIMIPAMLAYAGTFLRYRCFKDLNYQLLMLAGLLISVVLFSTGSENAGYIIACVGVGIWWAVLPKRAWPQWMLLGLILMASFARNLFPSDLYQNIIYPYALRAIPMFGVWCYIVAELYFRKFTLTVNEKTRIHHTAGL